MKRKYQVISIVIGFVLIIGILVFGMSQWNKQIDETAEQAKEDLNSTEQAKEEDLNVAEQAKDDSNLNGKSSTSVGDDSKEEDLSTGEKKQSESVRKPSESGELDSATGSTSADQNDTAKADGNSDFQDVAVNLPSNTDPSLTEIKAAYRDAFSDLEVQQTSQMDQLLLQAKADYVSGKLSKTNLAVRYQMNQRP